MNSQFTKVNGLWNCTTQAILYPAREHRKLQLNPFLIIAYETLSPLSPSTLDRIPFAFAWFNREKMCLKIDNVFHLSARSSDRRVILRAYWESSGKEQANCPITAAYSFKRKTNSRICLGRTYRVSARFKLRMSQRRATNPALLPQNAIQPETAPTSFEHDQHNDLEAAVRLHQPS